MGACSRVAAAWRPCELPMRRRGRPSRPLPRGRVSYSQSQIGPHADHASPSTTVVTGVTVTGVTDKGATKRRVPVPTRVTGRDTASLNLRNGAGHLLGCATMLPYLRDNDTTFCVNIRHFEPRPGMRAQRMSFFHMVFTADPRMHTSTVCAVQTR